MSIHDVWGRIKGIVDIMTTSQDLNIKEPFPELDSIIKGYTGEKFYRSNAYKEIIQLKDSGEFSEEEIDYFLKWAYETDSSIKSTVKLYDSLRYRLDYLDFGDSCFDVMDCIRNICISNKCTYPTAYRKLLGIKTHLSKLYTEHRLGELTSDNPNDLEDISGVDKKYKEKLDTIHRITELARYTNTNLDDTIELYDIYGMEYLNKYLNPISLEKECTLTKANKIFERSIEEIEKAGFADTYNINEEEFALLAITARADITEAMNLYKIFAERYKDVYANKTLKSLWRSMCAIVRNVSKASLTDIIIIYTSCIEINPNYRDERRLRNMPIALKLCGLAKASGLSKIYDMLDDEAEKGVEISRKKEMIEKFPDMEDVIVKSTQQDEYLVNLGLNNHEEHEESKDTVENEKGILQLIAEIEEEQKMPNSSSISDKSRREKIQEQLSSLIDRYIKGVVEKYGSTNPEEIENFVMKLISINPEAEDRYMHRSGKSREDLTPFDYYLIAVASVQKESEKMVKGLFERPKELLNFREFLNEKYSQMIDNYSSIEENQDYSFSEDIFSPKKEVPKALEEDIFLLLNEFYLIREKEKEEERLQSQNVKLIEDALERYLDNLEAREIEKVRPEEGAGPESKTAEEEL